MSKIGNPDFNWSALSLEKEFIRFIAHKTTNREQQGSFLRGWIGDMGEEKLESFNLTNDNFYNPDEILERLQQVIQPSTIAQSNKYKKNLITYRQTTETFSHFFVELKRRYDLVGGNIHAFRGKGQGKNNNYNNSYNNKTKCQNCGNFHKKDACRAKAKYAREDNKVQHKVQHKVDSNQNRNPAGLEVNKYMKLKMIICT